ncbi:hypothetical protein H8356DRAFT_55157 [Neocallimastix lanati (nom. inval.)]|uniref:Uncharacterized protein n=1 Tax=Neocallimastix californiae TaxID=1754190 RepID=A0A1Y1ZR30_9FUNG|nr:hypothetical protein H8356DRAFT_55157 [Neocallimastix sp. JGI-2020a]ORY12678.1 hypothetical protein LY90DRAFT_677760 [Neocallimastix californiae]|eukprot:ORY12678.1 hypothetical protein LY90DRAFT_677760 [Neocallimastix californiae]
MSWKEFKAQNSRLLSHIISELDDECYPKNIFEEFKTKDFKNIRLILISDTPLSKFKQHKATQNITKVFGHDIRLRDDVLNINLCLTWPKQKYYIMWEFFSFNLIEYLSKNIKAVYVLLGNETYRANSFIDE